MSEIRMFSYNWAPKGWALCDGQLLTINDNQALYALLGTNYGGDGRTNFALPDMRGRTPVNAMNSQTGINMGARAGLEGVTLTAAEMPEHTHQVNANTADGNTTAFAGSTFAGGADIRAGKTDPLNIYTTPSSLTPINPASVAETGNGQPHYNMQPSLVVSFCIAITGQFPSRN